MLLLVGLAPQSLMHTWITFGLLFLYLALLLVFLLIVKAKPKKASEDAPKDPEMTE